jgi:hypothetical protein
MGGAGVTQAEPGPDVGEIAAVAAADTAGAVVGAVDGAHATTARANADSKAAVRRTGVTAPV